jgi:hypothetical protein
MDGRRTSNLIYSAFKRFLNCLKEINNAKEPFSNKYTKNLQNVLKLQTQKELSGNINT